MLLKGCRGTEYRRKGKGVKARRDTGKGDERGDTIPIKARDERKG